jgi:hypothetical protein
MSTTYSTCIDDENMQTYEILVKILKEEGHYDGHGLTLGSDINVDLKFSVRCGLDSVAGHCEHENLLSVCLKTVNFFNDY